MTKSEQALMVSFILGMIPGCQRIDIRSGFWNGIPEGEAGYHADSRVVFFPPPRFPESFELAENTTALRVEASYQVADQVAGDRVVEAAGRIENCSYLKPIRAVKILQAPDGVRVSVELI